MHVARLTLDPAFRIGAIDPRFFGSLVERMGRCVYTKRLRLSFDAWNVLELRTEPE